MTTKQREDIQKFAQDYFIKLDQFHDKRHAALTWKYAKQLAKHYPSANLEVLEIACLLHDIGRVDGDKDHAHKSAQLVKPFLEKVGFSQVETDAIVHAIDVHNVKDIHLARSIEAKLLFDADKIQQMSVYGFMRACFYIIVLDHVDFLQATGKRYEKIRELWPHIQTPEARQLLEPQIEKVAQIVNDFEEGSLGNL